jgi:hypothetical protein
MPIPDDYSGDPLQTVLSPMQDSGVMPSGVPLPSEYQIREWEMDSGNYRGKCGSCGTANCDMLTDSICMACQLAEAKAEIDRLKRIACGLDPRAAERTQLKELQAALDRERAENERLNNKLNADNQNFELECQKAEIDREREEKEQLVGDWNRLYLKLQKADPSYPGKVFADSMADAIIAQRDEERAARLRAEAGAAQFRELRAERDRLKQELTDLYRIRDWLAARVKALEEALQTERQSVLEFIHLQTIGCGDIPFLRACDYIVAALKRRGQP